MTSLSTTHRPTALTKTSKELPILIPAGRILSIAAGNYHVVFVTEEGVFGWGENHSGQLGKHNEQKVYKEAVRI